MSAVAPAYIKTQPLPSGNCHCPQGYAPDGNADRACFYCAHPLRGTCHIDYGRDRYGDRIVERSTHQGERLAIRYAHQTVLPMPGFWLDLVSLREALMAARTLDDVQRLAGILPGDR